MMERDLDCKLRPDGSIDFDAYRAEAACERRAVRDGILWDVALPFSRSAPSRLLERLRKVALGGERQWTAMRP